jgi:predicted transcriptional regulator
MKEQMIENMTQALHETDFALADLQIAGIKASAVENLLILKMIKNAAELRTSINEFLNAIEFDRKE